MNWLNEAGPERDVTLTSRIRLARNIADIPFPTVMLPEHARQVAEKVRNSIFDFSGHQRFAGIKFAYIKMSDVPEIERQILVEKHLASQDLMEHPEVSAILLDSNEEITVMINEEDHIRMQCVLPGFQLSKAWETISYIDDLIEEQVDYAFHEEFGYLTSCPTNVGTGLRSSVMMHLPGLTMSNQMNAILQTITKIGLTARGIYGEGSEALGSIYQISNQVTLGPTEEDIINNLSIVSRQIVDKERQARKALRQAGGIQFEDSLWRACGLLMHARIMSLKEFMSLISSVRLAVSMGLIPGVALEKIDAVMTMGQPANVMKKAGGRLKGKEVDVERANIIRGAMREILNL